MRPRSIPPEEYHLLREFNKRKRRELEEKYGSSFFMNDANLPPEIEAQWLMNIDEYESKYKDAARVKVKDYCGDLQFKPIGKIPPAELKKGLKDILSQLEAHDIAVDYLPTVTEAELYRFITEELMDVEMDDIHMDGMVYHFIYEEFHP